MEIDITRLKHGVEEYTEIEKTISIEKETLKKADIIDLDNVTVKGVITKNHLDGYHLDMTISGNLILPCSITLEPVTYPINIKIDDELENLLSETDNFHKKVENTIDILPIIWENILMEIPIKVVSPNAKEIKTSGAGWRLITEEPKETLNPALEKLKDLL